jgi:hypothetical protein
VSLLRGTPSVLYLFQSRHVATDDINQMKDALKLMRPHHENSSHIEQQTHTKNCTEEVVTKDSEALQDGGITVKDLERLESNIKEYIDVKFVELQMKLMKHFKDLQIELSKK